MTNILASQLYLYPVKSMAGIAVNKLEFGKFGPLHDRNWMVIDRNGKAITQREQKLLALFKLDLTANYLEFNFNGDKFRLNHHSDVVATNKITAQIWQFHESLIDCGEEIAQYLSSHLKTNCRLVKIDSLFSRVSSGEITRPISLVDSRQLLVTSEESLAWLNELLAKEGEDNLNMNRFRPNIVLTGGQHIFYD